ncbi:MAG: hypothetical protein IK104_10375 [Clostridia bacterium]|nr:hypothetical protein [Clostridia bacterium]
MACFTVPAVEAIAVTAVAFILQKREMARVQAVKTTDVSEETKTPFSRKLKWLRNLLFGGSLLLAFEHVWHGEIVPWFPFLTAVENGEAADMLHEMATVGVTMAVLITAVWVGMVLVTNAIEKRAVKLQPRSAEENV